MKNLKPQENIGKSTIKINKIKKALSVTKNIDFYTYKVDFTLHKKNKDEQ